ncbi:cobalt/nickel transport system ATP-binding protein [Kineothrix alysoides]|uniref:Cobalt/nickel transport system ATP-binding protein n=1 Tax=Kineothrix alysoides TaxID=1469948 RepID=A0A4R1QY22_9FIRM|nr:ABC transporter ATP-binding protein [Kineothrix alysoides]TCL57484.1 cobalt/nickel transport system ATP-binding protein [Kineothrix alysoides]
MNRKILETKDLSFSYEEGRMALNHLSVEIYEKEKIAVLGANGAGKSTFFLNLNGVREPEEGEIFLYGNRIDRKNRRELIKNVGIVFQDADSQIIASTVKAEVAFGPLNMKLPRQEVEERTINALERLDLQAYAERPPHYLSGGEKKRVSIADILAMDSPIIIFDEPTASLDPVNADMLEKILEELEQEGKTILLSTHDVDFAYRFADRVLVFCEGKLIADRKPENIFRDEKILKRANLKKPVLVEVYEMLKQKNLLQKKTPQKNPLQEKLLSKEPLQESVRTEEEEHYPRTLAEIEALL